MQHKFLFTFYFTTSNPISQLFGLPSFCATQAVNLCSLHVSKDPPLNPQWIKCGICYRLQFAVEHWMFENGKILIRDEPLVLYALLLSLQTGKWVDVPSQSSLHLSSKSLIRHSLFMSHWSPAPFWASCIGPMESSNKCRTEDEPKTIRGKVHYPCGYIGVLTLRP